MEIGGKMNAYLLIESVEFSIGLPELTTNQVMELTQEIEALDYVESANAEDGKTLYIEVKVQSDSYSIINTYREGIGKVIADVFERFSVDSFLDQLNNATV